MKTHNAIIYHCLRCGRIVHSEAGPKPPHCCGKEMINAAAETVYTSEEHVSEAGRETAPPAGTGRRKAR